MTPPTKAQELAILDRAIKELGPVSYIGRYLAGIRGEVESDIRSDYEPRALTLFQAHEEAQRILRDADRDAVALRRKSEERAHALVADAESKVADIKRAARRELVRLADSIGQ